MYARGNLGLIVRPAGRSEGQQEISGFILWEPWVWDALKQAVELSDVWAANQNEISCLSVCPVTCELNWDWIACSPVHEVNHFLWFCHKVIKSVVPVEQCSHWDSGSRVTGRLLSCSRPKTLSFTPVKPRHRWPEWSPFHTCLMTQKICGSTVSVKAVTSWNRSGQYQGWEAVQNCCESSALLTCACAPTCAVRVSW